MAPRDADTYSKDTDDVLDEQRQELKLDKRDSTPETPSTPGSDDEWDPSNSDQQQHSQLVRSVKSELAFVRDERKTEYKFLRRWCALTHEPWRDENNKVLRGHNVREAHLIARNTTDQGVRYPNISPVILSHITHGWRE